MEMRELTRNSPPATRTTAQAGLVLSKPLTFWLLEETSEAKATEVIGKSDILKAEIRQRLPEIRSEALKPATEDQIKGIIAQRFALFPQPVRNDSEWASWWADYMDALAGLTAPAIEAGMAAWVRSMDAEFMCKPGKLRDLAVNTPNNNRWARAHRIAVSATVEPIKDHEKPKTERQERQSAEEVAAIMKDFHAVMKTKQPPEVQNRKAMKPIHGPVDSQGITAEGRAIIERMREAR
jgi:hypothetical protein